MFDFLQKYLMGPMGKIAQLKILLKMGTVMAKYFAITVPIFRRIF